MKVIRGALRLLGIGKSNSQIEISETMMEGKRVEPYGITTRPTLGNKAICLFPHGDLGNGIHFFTEDRREKPALEEGEVAVYYDQNNYIKFSKEDTKIKRNKMTMTLSSNGKLKIENNNGNFMTILSKLIEEIIKHETPTLMGPQKSPSGIKIQTILQELKGVLE